MKNNTHELVSNRIHTHNASSSVLYFSRTTNQLLPAWLSALLVLSSPQRDTVISFGNQSVALSDAPLIAHRCDYVFEVDGDSVLERPVACYNLCQVWHTWSNMWEKLPSTVHGFISQDWKDWQIKAWGLKKKKKTDWLKSCYRPERDEWSSILWCQGLVAIKSFACAVPKKQKTFNTWCTIRLLFS